ncbi:MAG: BON domain-containing protein [Phenylobacterium sp.]
MPREDGRNRDDFGQADYSTDYGYDPRRRAGYRSEGDLGVRGDDLGPADYGYDPASRPAARPYTEEDRDYARRMDAGDYPRESPPRSWMDRAGDFLSGAPRAERPAPRRRGPSDRVLWAVIVERLEDERRIDLRDVEVVVLDGEVTLNGTVRRKEDKRRIEDVADIDGVRHVQNNLRVRDGERWTFL